MSSILIVVLEAIDFPQYTVLVDATGMYTNEGTAIIISVVNIRQIPEFLNIVKKYPDTFVYYSDVTGVKGNFRWNKEDEAK